MSLTNFFLGDGGGGSRQYGGLRTVLVGDSICTPQTNGAAASWPERLCIVSQGRLLRVANFAIGGKRATEVLAQQLPSAIALKPDAILDNSGINDVFASGSTVAGVVAARKANIDAIAAAGILPIIPAILPGNDPKVPQVNDLIRRYCLQKGYIYLDLYGTLVNGAASPNYATVDGLHPAPSSAGAGAITTAALAALSAYPIVPQPPLQDDDGYSLRALFEKFVTVPGTANALPLTWTGNVYGGVAPTISRAAENGAGQYLVLTSSNSATSYVVSFGYTNIGGGNADVGDRIQICGRIDLTTGSGFGFNAGIYFDGIGTTVQGLSTPDGSNWDLSDTLSGVFCSELVVPPGATGVIPAFKLNGAGTAKIARLAYRNLTKLGLA